MQTPVLNPSAVYLRRIVQVSVSDTGYNTSLPYPHFRGGNRAEKKARARLVKSSTRARPQAREP
uniref:Uncharacterized protein n=1 Tax=Arundo donax TaxID=35708 RepID=A0A0A9H6I5_ARUDO